MAADMNRSSSELEMAELSSIESDEEVNPSKIAKDITPSTIIDIPAATIPSKGTEIKEKAGEELYEKKKGKERAGNELFKNKKAREVNKNEEHASKIPSTSAQPLNHPRLDFLNDERREDYVKFCVPLFEASLTGNWAAAKTIFDALPEMVRYAITEDHNTPLHVAASVGTTKLVENFVENLVELMNEDDMRLQNRNADAALCLAAAAGNVKIARIFFMKNNMILNICGRHGMFPLSIAVMYDRVDMVNFLFEIYGRLTDENGWTPGKKSEFLLGCVQCDLFDIALTLTRDNPELASDANILAILAKKPDALYTIKRSFINRISLSSKLFIYRGL